MATAAKKTLKLNVTATITLYTKTRNERLALDEQSKKLKVEEDNLLDLLAASKVAPGDYGPYHLDVKTKKVPRCTDWKGFHDYIKTTGNFDMLHKRLTESAVMARLDNGEYVPGVVTDDKVSYTSPLPERALSMTPGEINEYWDLLCFSGEKYPVKATLVAHRVYRRHPEWNNRVRNETKMRVALAYLQEKYDKHEAEEAARREAFIEERKYVMRAEFLVSELKWLLKNH